MKGFDMEANAMVQMALLAVLPLVMQGLKKILWVENNKGWVCPLLCIAASTATAYFMQLPQWLMVGIITGAACNKIYDWGKDLKNATMIILILLLPMLVFAGCGGPNTTPSTNYKTTADFASDRLEEMTILIQLGAFDQNDLQDIKFLTDEIKMCLDELYINVKADPNSPQANFDAADAYRCVRRSLIKLLVYQEKAPPEMQRQAIKQQ
jgi:hypothetical protein